MTLKGAKVVVLGGTSGMGLATAKAAHSEGATVVITGRSADGLERAKASLGGGVDVGVLEMADEAGHRAFFAKIGPFDHLVIAAAQAVVGPFLETDCAELRPAMESRFWGSYYAAKYAAPQINKGGSITFFSGVACEKPAPGMQVVAASCSAVESLARSLAVALAPIRVNTVRPGAVDTPSLHDALGGNWHSAEAHLTAKPAGRLGLPDEVAEAVTYLMKNLYTTGTVLTIDGGSLIV